MNSVVTIHDATILIDLIQTEFVDLPFSLNVAFQTTRHVFDELEAHDQQQYQPYLTTGQLQINTISVDGIRSVSEQLSDGSQLCFQDLSVICLAHESQSLLLTHVNLVRLEAKRHGLSVHSIIWVLDELLQTGRISGSQACHCLTGFMYANRRIIDCNCHQRLEVWATG